MTDNRQAHYAAMADDDSPADEYQGPVHYFASCALAWATGDTVEEAIEKCIRHAGTDTVKRTTLNLHKKGKTGFYVWSCRVLADSKADYRIEWFMPKGVDIDSSCHHDVTYITRKELAYNSRLPE
jgi:hypothetical protein